MWWCVSMFKDDDIRNDVLFHHRQKLIMFNGILQRFVLSLIFFFLLTVADRTFKQVNQLIYACLPACLPCLSCLPTCLPAYPDYPAYPPAMPSCLAAHLPTLSTLPASIYIKCKGNNQCWPINKGNNKLWYCNDSIFKPL